MIISKKNPFQFLQCLDWGTSYLNRKIIDLKNNTIVKSQRTKEGIKFLTPEKIEIKFDNLLKETRIHFPGVFTLISGMAGSEKGICEVPHVQTPASLFDLYKNLHYIAKDIAIIPGVKFQHPEEKITDLMRGEEIELFSNKSLKDGFYIFPGTHSKWLKIRNNKIVSIQTFITGELYEVLADHSILCMTSNPDNQENFNRDFINGFEYVKKNSSISLSLFNTRTLHLTKAYSNFNPRNYLSGILIGEEIIAGLTKISPDKSTSPQINAICGKSELIDKYKKAFSLIGINPEKIDSCFSDGHKNIYDYFI